MGLWLVAFRSTVSGIRRIRSRLGSRQIPVDDLQAMEDGSRMISRDDIFAGGRRSGLSGACRVFVGCCVLALATAGASAEDSMDELMKRVEAGDAAAQFEIGERYLQGKGVDQSPTEAADWYRKSAKQGDARAMGRLGGLLVLFGESGPVLSEGIDWLNKAIEKGDVDAMVALSKVYFSGKHPTSPQPDFPRILELLNAADAKGSAEAPVLLGGMYAEGRGVDKDYDKARALFERGVEAGSEEAVLALASVFRQGLGVDKSPEKVIELYKQAVEMGSGIACRRLAGAALSGYGMEKSGDVALEWFKKGAELNDSHCMRQLARHMMTGGDDAATKTKAFDMVRRAAELGDPAAVYDLAAFFDEGIGTQQDTARASELIYTAAVNGVLPAQVEMGARYREGVGVLVRDHVAAAAWFTQAAGAGSGEALYFLGVMHETGEGVPVQATMAADFYKRAIARGVNDAHVRLGGMLLDGRGVDQNPARAYAHFLIGVETRKDGPQILAKIEAGLTAEQKQSGRAMVDELRELTGVLDRAKK